MGVKIIELNEGFYQIVSTNTTLEKDIDWKGVFKRFDLNMIDGIECSFQINDDGIDRPLIQGMAKGWSYKEEITKISITTTDRVEILLRG